MKDEIRQQHEYMGAEVTAPKPWSEMSAFHFLVSGIGVRVLERWSLVWRALLWLMFRHHAGILIVTRGRLARGQPRAPLVVIDWETYSRMVLGLKPPPLADIDCDVSGAELALRETELRQ